MPEKGKNDTVTFINFYKKKKVPFVIYADFETIIKKIDDASRVELILRNVIVVRDCRVRRQKTTV